MQHGPLITFHLNLTQGNAVVRYSSKEEASKAQKSLHMYVNSFTDVVFLKNQPQLYHLWTMSLNTCFPGVFWETPLYWQSLLEKRNWTASLHRVSPSRPPPAGRPTPAPIKHGWGAEGRWPHTPLATGTAAVWEEEEDQAGRGPAVRRATRCCGGVFRSTPACGGRPAPRTAELWAAPPQSIRCFLETCWAESLCESAKRSNPRTCSEIWNLTSKNQANHLAIINVSGTVKNQETGGWGHTCKEAADLLPLLFLFCFVLRLFICVILIIRLGLQYSIDFVRRTVTKREVNLYRDFSLITDTVWKCILLQTDETSCHFF